MKKLIVVAVALSGIIFASSGEELVNKYGCLACHAVAGKKSAPGFAGIANKNIRFEGDNAKSVIINSIKNGSKGKYRRFANATMPPYKNISEKELSQIADYILSLAPKAKAHGRDGNCDKPGRGKGFGQGKGMGRN